MRSLHQQIIVIDRFQIDLSLTRLLSNQDRIHQLVVLTPDMDLNISPPLPLLWVGRKNGWSIVQILYMMKMLGSLSRGCLR